MRDEAIIFWNKHHDRWECYQGKILVGWHYTAKPLEERFPYARVYQRDAGL